MNDITTSLYTGAGALYGDALELSFRCEQQLDSDDRRNAVATFGRAWECYGGAAALCARLPKADADEVRDIVTNRRDLAGFLGAMERCRVRLA